MSARVIHLGAAAALVVTALVSSGCVEHTLRAVEDEGWMYWQPPYPPTIPCPQNRRVDILFVVDNSPSNQEAQATLARSVEAFIDMLEDPAMNADYRIGITTSDNGNTFCPTSTPEAGALVYSSCLDRLDDFVSSPRDLDVRKFACADVCGLNSEDLGISADSKPWLERIDGVSNLPSGVSTRDALSCLAPQGVSGCGFESQLESMNKALIRSQTETEAEFGFIREDAMLAVIHITDEADCSYNNDWASIFDPEGDRVFWGSGGDLPTSALCWNAGTACVPNDQGGYDCESEDYDIQGNPLAVGSNPDDDAVLHPVSRYVDRLQEIELEKWPGDWYQSVVVGLIGGVTETGDPIFAYGTDPVFEADYGIGPGCSAEVPGGLACTSNKGCIGIGVEDCGPAGYCLEIQKAVPPVRLAAFTKRFSEGTQFSVCESDYTPALTSIASAIRYQFRPACYSECVGDQDLTTPEVVDPECIVTGIVGTDDIEVSECLKIDGAYVVDAESDDYAMPNDNADICYAMLVDAAHTNNTILDDMSPQCAGRGYNLEFKLARRPNVPSASGTSIGATCVLSELPEVDCPDLYG